MDQGVTPTISATRLAKDLAEGRITARAVAESCISVIEEREPDIRAWAYFDAGEVRQRADKADAWRQAGKPLGPLHGVPVGIKDIIDTADMPTSNGTALDEGRRPRKDAFIVSRLRQAGAILLGKTETTELAYYAPSRTRNPHDVERTPGGSSSGSAAAVAAGMVPLAIGTQTNGSMIRPASFCGVVGYKPTHGRIPRSGMVLQSEPLDTVGCFATKVEDAALLAEVLQGYDPADSSTSAVPRESLHASALSEPPVRPQFAFVQSPAWDQASQDTKGALTELCEMLGDSCDSVELPESFANAHPAHARLMKAGFARNLKPWADRGQDVLSRTLREAMEEGARVSAVDYLSALDWRDVLNAGLEQIFTRYDAIITPAAAGEAPLGLESTGDPVFNTIWSLCGVPAISLPLAAGSSQMPIGVQLVGPRGQDGRLLRTARWLMNTIIDDGTEGDR